MRPQRGRQAEQAQRRRMEIVRQPANAVERVVHLAIEIFEDLLRFRIRDVAGAGPESIDADRHVGQLLADVVVQIAGDVGARRFLGVDEPPRHLPDAIVAGAQRRLARADGVVGAAQPRALPQQPGDQQQLRDHYHDRRHDVGAVQFPRGRHLETNVRARREPRLIDAPAPQLPPVEYRPDPRTLRRECSRAPHPPECAAPSRRGARRRRRRCASCRRPRPSRCSYRARCKSAPARPRRFPGATHRERSRAPWFTGE